MGKCFCGHRAAVFCRCLHSRPKHCGEEEKEKKTLLEQSQVQEEEMLLCEVSDLRSLVKTDSYHITDLKEAQLSNPQKYKFDFPLGGGRRRLRGFG